MQNGRGVGDLDLQRQSRVGKVKSNVAVLKGYGRGAGGVCVGRCVCVCGGGGGSKPDNQCSFLL